MNYVDGYVLPVKKRKLKEYASIAKSAGKIWIKHGALEYVESVSDDVTSVNQWKGLPFPKMVKTKPGEVVIFAYIVFKSKKHRDSVNAKVMKEMEKDKEKYKGVVMPFDLKKMAYAGFKSIVDERGK